MSLDQHRVRGSLLAAAVGDALGAPLKAIEVTRRIHFKYGRQPPGRLAYTRSPPARITDETQQLLFVAHGVIRHHLSEEDRADAVRDALVAWATSQKGPGVRRAPGWLPSVDALYFRHLPERDVELALKDAGNRPLPTLEEPVNDCDGPTAATRVFPYAVVERSPRLAFTAALHDTRWTHGAPIAGLVAGSMAAIVHGLLRGQSLAEALAALAPLLHESEGLDGPVSQAITTTRHIAAGGPPEPHHLEAMGDARDALSAFAIALCCTMTLEDSTAYGFVRTLWRSVCHGGSSDTTGALTGAMVGALLGVDAIPHPWLIDLEMVEVLERMAGDLFAVATARPVSESDYLG